MNSDRVQTMNAYKGISLRLEKVLLVAGVVVLFGMGVCFKWLSRFPLQQGYWVAGPDDDYAQLLLQVESVSASEKQTMILVGSSALREAFTNSDDLARNMPEYDWYLLTAGDLYLVETAQIVAALPRELSGVLLIETSMRILSTDSSTTQQIISKPRFPIQNWRFLTEMVRLGYTPSLGLGYASFYLSRWKWSRPTHVPREQWLFHQVDYIGIEQIDWERSVRKGELWLTELPLHLQGNLKLLKAIQQLAPPNMRVLLIESPRNSKWLNSLMKHPSWSVYQDTLAQLEMDFGGTTIQIDEGVESGNFLDHGHIRTLTGRKIATKNFLHSIAGIVHEQ